MTHAYRADLLAGELLSHPDADLVVSGGTLPPGDTASPMRIAPPHRHLDDDEIFVCISGKLAVEIDGEVVIAGRNHGVIVPRGAVHTWWNAHDEPSDYLILMPKRVNDLIAALHDPDITRSMDETSAAYGAEIVPDTR